MFKLFKSKKALIEEFKEKENNYNSFSQSNNEQILKEINELEEFDKEFEKDWSSIQKK